MKPFQSFQNWLRGGCIWFTVFSVALILLRLIVAGSIDGASISVTSFLLLLPASLCISGAGVLFRSERIPGWIRYLSHFLVTVLSIFFFLWLPSNTQAKASTVLILLVAFSALYWLLFLLVHLIQKRIRLLLEETKK